MRRNHFGKNSGVAHLLGGLVCNGCDNSVMNKGQFVLYHPEGMSHFSSNRTMSSDTKMQNHFSQRTNLINSSTQGIKSQKALFDLDNSILRIHKACSVRIIFP